MKTLMLDGTFKTAPLPFKQIWIVRGILPGYSKDKMQCLHLFTAFLQDKLYTSYEAALQVLKRECPLLKPDRIIIDYEAAEIKAIKAVYPGVDVDGCLFHYGQAVNRKTKSINNSVLAPQKKIDTSRVSALPYIKLDDLDSLWQLLKAELTAMNPTAADKFVKYFEHTWIGNAGRRPLFKPDMWNCHTRTLEGSPRTNNFSEGGNNALRTSFSCNHPVLWEAIEKLKLFQNETDIKIAHHNTGRTPGNTRRNKWMSADDRKVAVLRTYSTRTPREVLTLLALVRA